MHPKHDYTDYIEIFLLSDLKNNEKIELFFNLYKKAIDTSTNFTLKFLGVSMENDESAFKDSINNIAHYSNM